MSEEVKSASVIDGVLGVGKLALTGIAGIYMLGTLGVGGALVLGGLATVGVGIYAATQEQPVETFKGIFSKIGSFYKETWSDAKAGFGFAKDWAEKHEAVRSAPDVSESAVSKVKSPDFDKAASPAPVAQAAAKPAAKPTELGM